MRNFTSELISMLFSTVESACNEQIPMEGPYTLATHFRTAHSACNFPSCAATTKFFGMNIPNQSLLQLISSCYLLQLHFGQCLLKVPDDIVIVFYTNGKPD